MGLDLWFRADVARILQAAHEAMCLTAAAMGDAIAEGNRAEDAGGRERAAGYRQGFGAALRAVATAFGLTEIDGGHGGVVIDGDIMGAADGNHRPHAALPRDRWDARSPEDWGRRGA